MLPSPQQLDAMWRDTLRRMRGPRWLSRFNGTCRCLAKWRWNGRWWILFGGCRPFLPRETPPMKRIRLQSENFNQTPMSREGA